MRPRQDPTPRTDAQPRAVLRPLPETDAAAPVVFVTNALRPRGLRARTEEHRPMLAVVLR